MSIPVYIKETTNDMISNVVVDSGYALLFYQDEKLKLKLPDGNIIDATGSNNSGDSQIVFHQDINHLVDGNLVVTSDGFPVWIRTDKGNFYPVEKESLIYEDNCYKIKSSPYLVYDNVSEFSGTWRIYFACGTQSNGSVSGSTFPIGSIFPSISNTPPTGSYLLNGQTIFKCNKIYKQFYNWVNNSGTRIVDNETYEQELNSTGVCGAFVVNSENGDVRLPSIVQGTLWGGDNSNVGQSLAAGLPNITGDLAANIGQGGSGSGAISATNYAAGRAAEGGNYVYQNINFDASRSNPIYGNSDTVQPLAIRVSWCIQVYNATTALSEQESAQLASLLQVKAGGDNIRKEATMRIWESEEQVITNSTLYQINHNLNLTEEEIRKAKSRVLLKCITEEQGYQVGDIVYMPSDNVVEFEIYESCPLVRSNNIIYCKGSGNFWLNQISGGGRYINPDNNKWRMIFQIFY